MRLRIPRRASRWFIGTLAWPSGRATSAAIQQVAGPHPPAPLRDDVESEPGRVLVELADPRVDDAGVELRSGQLVERGDDADVGRVGEIRAAEDFANSRT